MDDAEGACRRPSCAWMAAFCLRFKAATESGSSSRNGMGAGACDDGPGPEGPKGLDASEGERLNGMEGATDDSTVET